MAKKQVLAEPGWARWVAFAGKLLLALEDAVEEYGLENIYVDTQVFRQDYVPRVVGIRPEPPVDGVEEYVEDRVDGLSIRRAGGEVSPMAELYRAVLRVYLSRFAAILLRHAAETSETGTEYLAAVVGDGKLVVLEGDEGRVTIPFIQSWVTGHTHPAGHCLFSHKDVASMRDFYTHGGLVTGVITTTCSMVLWREGPYTMDDHLALIGLEKALKRLRRPEDVPRIFEEFSGKARNLRYSWVRGGEG